MSAQEKRPRKRRGIVFVCTLLTGVLLSALLRGNPEPGNTSNAQTVQRLTDTYAQLSSEQQRLRDELDKIEAANQAYESAIATTDASAQRLLAEAREAELYAGHTDLHGPGIEVTLSDAKDENLRPGAPVALYIVHDSDVLKVINELRSAGAEAISINDVRVLGSTRIRCGGPTIHIKDRPLAPPFVIRAIGDPAALEARLKQGPSPDELSVYQELTYFGIVFTIRRDDDLLVSRSIGTRNFVYARQEGE